MAHTQPDPAPAPSDEQESNWRKERNRDHLEGDQLLMTWTIFAAAAVAGGNSTERSAKVADAMIDQAKARFL